MRRTKELLEFLEFLLFLLLNGPQSRPQITSGKKAK